MRAVLLSLLVVSVQCDFNKLVSSLQSAGAAHLNKLTGGNGASVAPIPYIDKLNFNQDSNKFIVNFTNIAEGFKNKNLSNIFEKEFIANDMLKLDSGKLVDKLKNLEKNKEFQSMISQYSQNVMDKMFGNLSADCKKSFNEIQKSGMSSTFNVIQQKLVEWGQKCNQSSKLQAMLDKMTGIGQEQIQRLDKIVADLPSISAEFKTLVANKNQNLTDLIKGQADIFSRHPDSSRIFALILADIHRNTTDAFNRYRSAFHNQNTFNGQTISQVRPQVQILPFPVKETSGMATAVETADEILSDPIIDNNGNKKNNNNNNKNKKKNNKNNKKNNKKNKAAEEDDYE